MLGILSATFYNFRQIRSSYSVKNVTKYFCCGLDGSPIRAQDWISSTWQAIYVWHTTEALSRNNCCGGQVISIPYSKCMFLALVIRHAIRMRRIVLSSMSCLATIFVGGGGGERIGYETCVLTFFTVLSEIFLIIRIIRYDIAINVY